jgi:hypothetical protein
MSGIKPGDLFAAPAKAWSLTEVLNVLNSAEHEIHMEVEHS